MAGIHLLEEGSVASRCQIEATAGGRETTNRASATYMCSVFAKPAFARHRR